MNIATDGLLAAIQRWVNEGGSHSPVDNGSQRALTESPGKEARDTVAGCRDLATQDRFRAEAVGTENARRAYERSAASWESRADAIEKGEMGSATQRAIDRALWAQDEKEDPIET